MLGSQRKRSKQSCSLGDNNVNIMVKLPNVLLIIFHLIRCFVLQNFRIAKKSGNMFSTY